MGKLNLNPGKESIKMAENKWIFLGDVNPVEHGGLWMRQEEGNPNSWEFIKVQEWFDEHIAVAHGYVDVTDEWIDREAVESYGDCTLEGNPDFYVDSVISYYGIAEFDSAPDYIQVDDFTEGKVKKYLEGQGIKWGEWRD